jgi:DNA helicase HerA-like ATPase
MPPSLLNASLPFHADRLRHVLVVGKTGAGKSHLLRAIARHDLHAGTGLMLVDPHGDLASDVLSDVPRFRRNDVIRFAPYDGSCPGLNPFRLPAGASPNLAVSALLSTFEKLFGDSWGFRTEHLLRFAFLALMGQRSVSLLDARALFLDERRRASVLKRVNDPIVLDFWLREFAALPKPFLAEILAAPLNKLGALLGSPVIRDVVTRSRPKLDLGSCLARKRVVVADLAKGVVGEDGCRFLGGLLVGALEQAALARASFSPEERAPFMAIIDEAGNFASASLRAMLAEARKYAIGLTICVQSLAALPEETRSALLGNVGTLVSFRVGGEDAELLSREFAARFGIQTLTGLGIGEMVVREGGNQARIFDSRAP